MDYISTSYNILSKIYKDKSYSNIALSSQNIDERALVTKIVYGVLENSLLLDYQIKQASSSSPKAPIKLIVKIALYCIKFLSIPSYAIISNSLKLCDKIGKGAVKGYVNAVLNKLLKQDIVLPGAKDNILEYYSIKYSVNIELVRLLVKDYGNDVETIFKALSSNNSLEHIRPNLNIISKNEFIKLLEQNNISYTISKAEGFYINFADLNSSNIDKSLYFVMGFGSMSAVNLIEPVNRGFILDTCAAPGGKSILLAERNKSSKVYAMEIHPHRVELIKKYIEKAQSTNIEVFDGDATHLNPDFLQKFDIVLCDVPCSGLGTAHKKPDIKLFKTESDIKNLSELQLSIINNCSNYVKKGGYLYYGTCTIFPQENCEVVNSFLKSNKEFIKTDLIGENVEDGFLNLICGINADDGFFMAKLKRI